MIHLNASKPGLRTVHHYVLIGYSSFLHKPLSWLSELQDKPTNKNLSAKFHELKDSPENAHLSDLVIKITWMVVSYLYSLRRLPLRKSHGNTAHPGITNLHRHDINSTIKQQEGIVR
jgi:hypothetical protein